jgi:exodeoxyribonuclease VII small subunit
MKIMEKFDYKEAVRELESIAAKVEDPSTGLDDIDKYVKRSKELIAACRAYLRTVRDKVDKLDTI